MTLQGHCTRLCTAAILSATCCTRQVQPTVLVSPLLLLTNIQACAVRKGVAQWASSAASWGVSMLHFAGVVKPNPDAKQDGKGAAANIKEAAAATAETARAAMTDAHVVSGAMQEVQNQMANVAMVRGSLCDSLAAICSLRLNHCCSCIIAVHKYSRARPQEAKHGVGIL